jgi:hypothetical protein
MSKIHLIIIKLLNFKIIFADMFIISYKFHLLKFKKIYQLMNLGKMHSEVL